MSTKEIPKAVRHLIYIEALAIMEGWRLAERYNAGLCYFLDIADSTPVDVYPYYDMHLFPEIIKHKPDDSLIIDSGSWFSIDIDSLIRDSGFWFPIDKKGMAKRNTILRQAIKDTEK